MSSLKNGIIALLLALLVAFSFAQMAKAEQYYPVGSPVVTEQDKILQDYATNFLTSVFRLNIPSYNATMLNTSPAPFGIFLTLDFVSSGSEFHVLTEFNNSELIWCMLDPVKGSPNYIMPQSPNVISAANDALDGIQAFSAKDYLPTFKSMLNTVSELNSSTISNANYTQETTVNGNDVTITWEPSANGLSNQQDNLKLEFQNGNLILFNNFLDVYRIGNADVKISEQEAIQIATEHVQDYSYEQDNETVSNVTVLGNLANVGLSLQNRGNATLYPLWNILLALDKMYPGGVTSFQVLIWADTGQVSSITPAGAYGVPNGVLLESPTPTPTAPEFPILTIQILLIIMVGAGFLVYFKKRKHYGVQQKK